MKRSTLSLILMISIIVLACFLLFSLVENPFNFISSAAETFGPPDESLTLFEKLHLSFLIFRQEEKLSSPSKSTGDDVPFQVDLGESTFSVTNRLSDLGLIRDPDSFRNFLVYSGIDTQIQAGKFILNPIMTPIEIAWKLQNSAPSHVDYSILAGWRIEEIAANVKNSGLGFPSEALIDYVYDNGLEGYLHPGIYSIRRDINPDQMVFTFLDAFNSNLTAEMESGFEHQGFSIQEAVILASIVEREAVVDDEMPLIASVFINRINVGARLSADPTIQYALGYNESQGTWWTNPLSASDLEIDSPYNTYLYLGLPPGPICNPGITALQAVAFPIETPYYYFRAACDNSGRHLFAETYEDHLMNACP